MIRHDIQQIRGLSATSMPTPRPICSTALQQRGDHGAHAQPASGRTGRGLVGGDWLRATPAKTSSPGAGRIWSASLADLVPTAHLLDTYSPEVFCTIRNFADVAPKIAKRWKAVTTTPRSSAVAIAGTENPYVYPDNLPRANATGGPGGAPGCWQTDHP